MVGTKQVAQTAPRVGAAGGLLRNMAKEGTHMQASSSGDKEVVGELGRHILMEAVRGDCGRGCPMGRPVIARAGGQAGQRMGQEAKTSVNQHQPRG